MKRWYVAHTLVKGEEIALQHLRAQGFEAFLPKYHRTRRHARKVDVVIAPLFPRYLFVAFDAEVNRWLAINSTRGVSYLLTQSGNPLSVPAGIVEELKNRSDISEIVPLSSLELFKPGACLEVLEGIFSGHTGIYEKMADSERVQILLNLLGRPVKINVPLHAVVAVA